MSLVAAAVVPAAPLLVPEVAGGSAGQDARLRHQVDDVVRRLAATGAEVVVIGGAPRTGLHEGGWSWRSLGVAVGAAPADALPLSLGLGSWLLDRAEHQGRRRYVGVADVEDAAACAALGRSLVSADDVAALVVADGSACRTEKAPGHLDARAEPFDAVVAAALRNADRAALLALERELAADLLVSARAPLQVLAGAAGDGPWSGALHHDAAPYGVTYFVAEWWRT